MLKVIFDVPDTGSLFFDVAELRLLREAVESQFLPLGIKLIDHNCSIFEVLADVPVIINRILPIPKVIVLVQLSVLFIPPNLIVMRILLAKISQAFFLLRN